MHQFTSHTGRVAVLKRANVDTDQIIPKQFLKQVGRTGFGSALFHDWRYRPDGAPNPEFELNQPDAAGATILLAGPNFGCGSSREHAVWALMEYGFRAVLSASFADIFLSNSLQNGLLPVRLAPAEMATLFAHASGGSLTATVDLRRNRVTDSAGFSAGFEIDAYHRELLLSGLDAIALTLTHEPAIAAYERRRASFSTRLGA